MLDEGLLREARDARERALNAEFEAARSQLAFQHSIRKLHAAGATLREIADALEMSHQRVHQIVEPGSGKAGLKDMLRRRRPPHVKCSFCGGQQADRAKIIAGPGVYICDRCLAQVSAILRRERATGKRRFRATDDPKEAALTCSFCGKSRTAVKQLVAGPGVYICNECTDLCNSIIEAEAGG